MSSRVGMPITKSSGTSPAPLKKRKGMSDIPSPNLHTYAAYPPHYPQSHYPSQPAPHHYPYAPQHHQPPPPHFSTTSTTWPNSQPSYPSQPYHPQFRTASTSTSISPERQRAGGTWSSPTDPYRLPRHSPSRGAGTPPGSADGWHYSSSSQQERGRGGERGPQQGHGPSPTYGHAPPQGWGGSSGSGGMDWDSTGGGGGSGGSEHRAGSPGRGSPSSGRGSRMSRGGDTSPNSMSNADSDVVLCGEVGVDQMPGGLIRRKRNKDRDKGRGSYRCGKCGVPKKGHICPYQPKFKRRPDEPAPETRNASTQVEMDEFLVLRRLNLEIQGFPESYTSDPANNVGAEPHHPQRSRAVPSPNGPPSMIHPAMNAEGVPSHGMMGMGRERMGRDGQHGGMMGMGRRSPMGRREGEGRELEGMGRMEGDGLDAVKGDLEGDGGHGQ